MFGNNSVIPAEPSVSARVLTPKFAAEKVVVGRGEAPPPRSPTKSKEKDPGATLASPNTFGISKLRSNPLMLVKMVAVVPLKVSSSALVVLANSGELMFKKPLKLSPKFKFGTILFVLC